jgi:prenyltransferase beta subunit
MHREPSAPGHSPLRLALDAAARHVLQHQTPQGAIHQPSTGRSFETALVLHLLEGVVGFDGERARLRAFCRRFLQAPRAPSALGRLGELDGDVSRAMVAAALGRPERRAYARRAHSMWAAFDHPSRDRKLTLWSVLLAELDPELRSPEPVGMGGVHTVMDQAWARLLMTAVATIDAIARAGPSAASREALDMLAAGQSTDGSWMRHGLLTATALIAFKKAGRYDAVFQRGVEYLRRVMRSDGSLPFVPDLDIWVTGLAGLILSRLPGQRFDLEPLARYLVEHQLPSGAWCFTTDIAVPDLDDTAVCLMFLQRWNAAAHGESILRARQSLLGFRNDDGGFSTYARGGSSEAEVTARGVMALASEKDRYATEIGAALQWLEGAQSGDGTFGLEWILCTYHPIAQMLFALASVAPRDAFLGMARKSVRYVLANQNSDGGWGPVPGAASQSLPTSYALIALAHAPTPRPEDPIRRGACFLIHHQRPDGGFASPPDAVGPRPLVYEMELFPTLYALWGLSAAVGIL